MTVRIVERRFVVTCPACNVDLSFVDDDRRDVTPPPDASEGNGAIIRFFGDPKAYILCPKCGGEVKCGAHGMGMMHWIDIDEHAQQLKQRIRTWVAGMERNVAENPDTDEP